MNIRDLRKKTMRWAARFGMGLGMALVRLLPYGLFCFLMRIFAFGWFCGAKKLRKAARESLTIAFGSTKTPDEIARIVRECFSNISGSMMDLMYHSFRPEEVKERFQIENIQYLDQALARGKGVILITAHFGNFPLMLLELAQLGYKPSVILKKARDEQVAQKIYEIMSRVGVETIYNNPPRDSVRKSLQVLRNNNILCVLLDQNFGTGSGVFVEFFGEKAATASGPIVMAERTGATIVPVFTIHEGRNSRMFFEPIFELEDRPDYDEKILVNVARITKIIEMYIRRYPAEWGWMHRRWKCKEQPAVLEGEKK